LDDVVFYVKKTPKWLTVLDVQEADTSTGEIVCSIYETDDIKAATGRKIKAIKAFCDFYDPLYKVREVSLLFHTFTRTGYAKDDMRRMLDIIKRRYLSLDRCIRGYLWAIEISPTGHVHYHLIVAIDRVNFKRIPNVLKLEDAWGQRTGVEFVKKSVRHYLSKYLYKAEGGIILKRRGYARSRKFK